MVRKFLKYLGIPAFFLFAFVVIFGVWFNYERTPNYSGSGTFIGNILTCLIALIGLVVIFIPAIIVSIIFYILTYTHTYEYIVPLSFSVFVSAFSYHIFWQVFRFYENKIRLILLDISMDSLFVCAFLVFTPAIFELYATPGFIPFANLKETFAFLYSVVPGVKYIPNYGLAGALTLLVGVIIFETTPVRYWIKSSVKILKREYLLDEKRPKRLLLEDVESNEEIPQETPKNTPEPSPSSLLSRPIGTNAKWIPRFFKNFYARASNKGKGHIMKENNKEEQIPPSHVIYESLDCLPRIKNEIELMRKSGKSPSILRSYLNSTKERWRIGAWTKEAKAVEEFYAQFARNIEAYEKLFKLGKRQKTLEERTELENEKEMAELKAAHAKAMEALKKSPAPEKKEPSLSPEERLVRRLAKLKQLEKDLEKEGIPEEERKRIIEEARREILVEHRMGRHEDS